MRYNLSQKPDMTICRGEAEGYGCFPTHLGYNKSTAIKLKHGTGSVDLCHLSTKYVYIVFY